MRGLHSSPSLTISQLYVDSLFVPTEFLLLWLTFDVFSRGTTIMYCIKACWFLGVVNHPIQIVMWRQTVMFIGFGKLLFRFTSWLIKSTFCLSSITDLHLPPLGRDQKETFKVAVSSQVPTVSSRVLSGRYDLLKDIYIPPSAFWSHLPGTASLFLVSFLLILPLSLPSTHLSFSPN